VFFPYVAHGELLRNCIWKSETYFPKLDCILILHFKVVLMKDKKACRIRCGVRSSSIYSSWELLRRAAPQDPAQSYWFSGAVVQKSVLSGPPADPESC
jgi:hypothetical protein